MEFPESAQHGIKILERSQGFEYKDEVSFRDPSNRVLQSDTVVYSKDGNIFVSKVSEMRHWFLQDVNLEELGGVKVNKDVVFPKFESGRFTMASESNENSYYVKRARLIDYEGEEDTSSVGIGVLMRREASVCEVLRKSPHPNIAKYHGCLVEEGRIVGLCFEKYTRTLSDMMEDGLGASEKTKIYSQIRDAISHLHGLKYCHNDLHDKNVMITERGDAVLIDFDSTVPEGEILSYKGGAPDWSMDNNSSAKENDYYSLGKLREYLAVNSDDDGDNLGRNVV